MYDDRENGQREVDRVDTGLEYVGGPGKGSFSRVYKVQRGGQFYVLKVARNISHGSWHVNRERAALDVLYGVPGIAHLVRDYGSVAGLPTILKEFCPGSCVRDLYPAGMKSDLIEKLKRIVRDVHSLGVAGLDLHVDNVIVSPDCDVYVVDFGFCRSSQELGSVSFGVYTREDEDAIRKLSSSVHSTLRVS